MLHTKFRENRPAGSVEEGFWRVSTIYGRGGHLGHDCDTDAANKLSFVLPKEAPHKILALIGQSVLEKIFEHCERRTTPDGRTTDHEYPIAHL